MEATARLAGFFAAHGVWCVSDGEGLVPMVAYERGDGTRQMQRFAGDTLEGSVEAARKWAHANPEGADRMVVVFDGRIELEGGKTDALIVEAYDVSGSSFVMAIPYRNATSAEGFAVHRPKFLSLEAKHSDSDPSFLGQAFFDGVEEHEKGAAIWNRHLDESR